MYGLVFIWVCIVGIIGFLLLILGTYAPGTAIVCAFIVAAFCVPYLVGVAVVNADRNNPLSTAREHALGNVRDNESVRFVELTLSEPGDRLDFIELLHKLYPDSVNGRILRCTTENRLRAWITYTVPKDPSHGE